MNSDGYYRKDANRIENVRNYRLCRLCSMQQGIEGNVYRMLRLFIAHVTIRGTKSSTSAMYRWGEYRQL